MNNKTDMPWTEDRNILIEKWVELTESEQQNAWNKMFGVQRPEQIGWADELNTVPDDIIKQLIYLSTE